MGLNVSFFHLKVEVAGNKLGGSKGQTEVLGAEILT